MASATGQFLQAQSKQPRLIFVTGGPGTGKGTQCANLVEFQGFKHISIGDLVRAEIKSGSEVGQSIEAIVKAGNLVPKELVVSLLGQALQRTKAHTLLVDGFPRDTQQAVFLEQTGIRIDYILHYEADSDDVLLERLLERGRTSGRADDNEETIVHRFQVYKSESLPVLALYEPFNILHRVNCMGSIQEVYHRTLRTLRPELLCIMGPISAGKTTVAQKICEKYKYEYLHFRDFKSSSRNEDELIGALVKKLGSYKHEYRVLVDGFPETFGQARLFAAVSGDPDYVLYLQCPKDVSQERILRLGKQDPGYLPSPDISKKYQDFADEAKGLKAHYQKQLKGNFKEVDGGNDNKFYVQSQAFEFVEPEVVLVRGFIIPSFLTYLHDRLNYQLVNASQLLRLWREARALSSSEDLSSLPDDPELLDLLKNMIYSGTKSRKFAIYNFALSNFSLFRDFDMFVASVKRTFFLNWNWGDSDGMPRYSSLPRDQENITEHLFCAHKGVVVPILPFYSNLSDTEAKYYDKVISEQSESSTAQLIWVFGPKLSGKTTTAKMLTSLFGFQSLDFSVVIEETKAALSTEEEPKEALNFTEFCTGLQVYLRKRPGQFFVYDGLPDPEILTLPGGKDFKDLEIPEPGEEIAIEEDPSVVAKMTGVAERWESLFQNYIQLASHTILQMSASTETIIKRARKAAELTDEDETPADLLAEISESGLWVYYLSQRSYFPTQLADSYTYSVPSISAMETRNFVEKIFTRRLILFKNTNLVATTDLIKRFCYRYRITYLNFFSICDQTMRINDSLGTRLKHAKQSQAPLPFDLKLEVLSAYVQKNVPLRCRFVVLFNYEFPRNDEFPGCFDELAALEKVIGRLHAFVNVTKPESLEYAIIEDLPVRQRKKPKVEGEEEEEVKKDPEEAEVPEEALPPPIEEPEIVPMWNNSQPSNLTLTFQNYKGIPAELITIQAQKETLASELEAQLETVIRNLDSRWNIQYVISQELISHLAVAIEENIGYLSPSWEYYEPLPLDISDLGNYAKKLEQMLVNPRAKEFHEKYLKQVTVPFSTFFQYFSRVLEQQGLKPTLGLREAISNAIDSNQSATVSADELSSFFDLWEDESSRAELLRQAHLKDAEAKKSGDFIGYGLQLIITDAEPDPMTGAMTFKPGTKFAITYEGCPSSPRFCADRATLVGKENRNVSNDIVFSSADTRIKNHHFSILSLPSGFYFADAGTTEGLRLKLEDNPILLTKNSVLLFGTEDKCFVRTCTVSSPPVSDPFLHPLERIRNDDSEDGFSLSEDPVLELEFLSGHLYRKRVRLHGNEKPRFLVGNSPDCDVYLPQTGASLQAWIQCSESGWTLLDMQSASKTWIYVNTYDRILTEKPSYPLKIRNGQIFAIPGTVFKAAFKHDNRLNLTLSDYPEIRQIRFRDAYTINKKIGKGAYSQVLECTHKGSKVRYAAKVISKAKIDPAAMEELTKLKKLDHQNVAKVQDVVEDGRDLYIVAELLAGDDILSTLSQEAEVTEEKIALVMREVLSAVAYLHAQNTPHKNINPAVFKRAAPASDSTIKLIDFGTARLLLPAYQTEERLGTHQYQSPEAFKGKYDLKSDIWSCGALLYVLFCGQPPFPGKTAQEVYEKSKGGRPTFKEVGWKKVSRSAKRLLGMMLAQNLNQRPTAKEALQHPWTQKRSKAVDYAKPMAEKAFKNLRSFASGNKLQQALLTYMASSQITAQERDATAAFFASLDTEGVGFLTKAELKAGFSSSGFDINDADLETLISGLDVQKNGVISYSEFLNGVVARTEELSKERLNALFESIDQDASGEISATELKAVLGRTEGEWQRLIGQVDENKDGKIDIREFKTMMLSASG